jgi:putative ABC transport system permease protein
MSWWTSWRLAVRLARRDLFKHKARAIIALVMVTLPVLAVVAIDILIQTSDVSTAESVDRQLGTNATALVRREGPTSSRPGHRAPATEADVEKAIGRRTMLAYGTSDAVVATAKGNEIVTVGLVDGSAPLAHGLYRLTSGHWPSAPGQVVVNQPLHDQGVADRLTVVSRDRSEKTYDVVGTVVDATTRTGPVVVGLPGWLPDMDAPGTPQHGWLIDGPRLTGRDMARLGALGVSALDRYQLTHPGVVHNDYGDGDQTAQVAALVIVMALIEVVLLAGPAFAVGARKQQRSLALLVSSGGTPRQSRRVIIAGGWILGVTAGVVGVVGGIGLGWVLQPVVQHFDDLWLGPFEIPWRHLAAVAVFGLVSALIACLVPAWIASRQNVVAVLAGRRGDAKPVRAFPWIGLVLFGVGVLVAIAGTRPTGGELTIAWAAVICVLGMVLLVPVVVTGVARVARRFPLPIRFAARDAVRHRTRTTPAVAAVAATVAGVVALGIATSSDAKENRETYQPTLVMGEAAVTRVTWNEFGETDTPTDWKAVEAAVRREAPNVPIRVVRGVVTAGIASTWSEVTFSEGGSDVMPDWMSGAFGSNVLVSDGTDLPAVVAAAAPGVAADLAAGRAVVFGSVPAQAGVHDVTMRVATYTDGGRTKRSQPVAIPARVVALPLGTPSVQAVVPPAVAKRSGLPVQKVGLDLPHPALSSAQQKSLQNALQTLPTPAAVYVERGYQSSQDVRILQGLLLILAAVLMLGGTLTAMFLALSDARPDLATLAAVGAEARVRRKVAAAYTFVVSFVGAVLGMLVGFVPGVAVTWPLTGHSWTGRGPFLDVPWLLIAAVVVGLPLLTSLIVGACVRSRLPMVSRLS